MSEPTRGPSGSPAESLADRLGAMTEMDALAAIGATVTPMDGGHFVEHCGEPMSIGSGILGPDIVRCDCCGALIERPDSPHINGGYILSDEAYAELEERHWVPYVPSAPLPQSGGTDGGDRA